MSMVYFAADLHLGHKNVHKFRKQFSSAEEHDAVVRENFEKVLTKRDKLFLLGDIAFNRESLEWVSSLRCTKVLVCGNHDTQGDITMKDVVRCYDEVYSLTTYKGYWLTHCPIHVDEIRGRKGVIYGHTHNHKIDHILYHCVSLEHTDMKPVLFDNIFKR